MVFEEDEDVESVAEAAVLRRKSKIERLILSIMERVGLCISSMLALLVLGEWSFWELQEVGISFEPLSRLSSSSLALEDT